MTDSQSTPSPDQTLEQVTSSFQQTLDKHGFSFQYAVIKKARELFESSPRRSTWSFQASEFPVEIHGTPIHIDFLLNKKRNNYNFVMVCECKRSNPALSNWCFSNVGEMRRNDIPRELIVERVESRDTGLVTYPSFWSSRTNLDLDVDVYHLGLEVRTRDKGDNGGTGRGAIEQALSQVFRGVNGLVELLNTHKHLVTGSQPWFLLPVIFTTANLFGGDAKIEEANLLSGKLEHSPSLSQVLWLAFNYPVSPGLKHGVPDETSSGDLSALLRNEYMRTAFIVSAAGIEDFLKWSSEVGIVG